MQFFSTIPVHSTPKMHHTDREWLSIISDYNTEPLTSDIKVALSYNETYLTFTTQSKLFTAPTSNEGIFKEGLWEDEVSELFIFNKSTSAYQEYHASPKGFYWGMNFSSHRQRVKQIEGITYFSSESSFGIKIPISSLLVPLSNENSLIHISGVLRKDPYNGILYSSKPLENTQPDFHDVKSTLPVVLLSRR